MKTTLKIRILTFSFAFLFCYFFSNELSFPGGKKCWKDVIRHCIDFVSHPFSSFLFSCCVLFVGFYICLLNTHTRSKNSLSSTNVGREEKRSKYFFINPNEKKKYSLVHCSFQFHHDEWNAHTITRFLLYVVVTIIFRELSVIYIYMNTLLDIEHWLNMSKATSPVSCRFMLR